MTVVYRDDGAWGSGLGVDLSALQIDGNFWTLVSEITDIQATILSGGAAGVDYFSIVDNNQLYVTLTNHTTSLVGTLPSSAWDVGPGPAVQFWGASTAYAVNAVFQNDGSLYIVIYSDPGQPTFDPNANDGLGHNYFALLLASPSDVLAAGGAAGSFLLKLNSDPYTNEWVAAADITWPFSQIIDVPAATSSNLGLIYGIDEITSEWIKYIDPHGAPVLTQPAFVDISGTVANAQLVQALVQTVSSTGGVLTIDYTLGENCLLTMTENITSMVINNWPGGTLGKITLFITNPSWAISNWAGALWPGGTAPTVGTKDVYVLANNTAIIYGAVVGQSYA
jgi:hypothetical protein